MGNINVVDPPDIPEWLANWAALHTGHITWEHATKIWRIVTFPGLVGTAHRIAYAFPSDTPESFLDRVSNFAGQFRPCPNPKKPV